MPKKKRGLKIRRAKPDDPIFKQGLVIYTPARALTYSSGSSELSMSLSGGFALFAASGNMPSSRSTSTTARRTPSFVRMSSISRANRRLGIFCAERRAS